MSDFKNGGVPAPDYDTGNINYVNDVTEFTEDVLIYSDAYAQSFNGVEIVLLVQHLHLQLLVLVAQV